MHLRFARLCLAAFLLALGGGVRGQAPAPTGLTSPSGDELVLVKLPDADLETILSALEMYTGRVATLRPAALPTTTYNLVFNKPAPISEVIQAIETVLALNGISVVPLGDKFLKVVALNNARMEAPEIIVGSTLDRPPGGRVASKVFQLEFLRVAELGQMLNQNTLNPLYGGPVLLPNANAIMITDSISNLQRVERLLQEIDRPVSAGMRPKFYQLQNGAKASDVVAKLRTALTGALTVQLGQATTYSADDRTNQIILVTDPRQHALFDELIAKLDVRSDPITRNEVIVLNHAEAEAMVTVLSAIVRGQTAAVQRQNSQSTRPGQPGSLPTLPGQPNQPGQPQAGQAGPGGALAQQQAAAAQAAGPAGLANVDLGSNEFSSIMTIVADTRSNAVVVSGTTDDIRLIRELIGKLDIVLAQVRIEVVIAEVTLEDNHQSGISALGLQIEGDKLVGFSGTAAGGSVANGIITRPGLTGGFDLAMEIAVNTTPRKGDNNIVSRPAIVTSHGKEGIVFYGETRPVITGVTTTPGAATGTTSTSQVTQQPIGTTLTVTPFIGQDGSVQLDIVQDISDVTGSVVVDGNTQYVIGRRQSTSYVSAKSGDILVLGGFVKNTDTRSTNRLGPIPIIGDLLGSRVKNTKRQELIFFLRPVVLTNQPAMDNAEALQRIEQLPNRDQIKQQLDPNFKPEPTSALDRIRPRS